MAAIAGSLHFSCKPEAGVLNFYSCLHSVVTPGLPGTGTAVGVCALCYGPWWGLGLCLSRSGQPRRAGGAQVAGDREPRQSSERGPSPARGGLGRAEPDRTRGSPDSASAEGPAFAAVHPGPAFPRAAAEGRARGSEWGAAAEPVPVRGCLSRPTGSGRFPRAYGGLGHAGAWRLAPPEQLPGPQAPFSENPTCPLTAPPWVEM